MVFIIKYIGISSAKISKDCYKISENLRCFEMTHLKTPFNTAVAATTPSKHKGFEKCILTKCRFLTSLRAFKDAPILYIFNIYFLLTITSARGFYPDNRRVFILPLRTTPKKSYNQRTNIPCRVRFLMVEKRDISAFCNNHV